MRFTIILRKRLEWWDVGDFSLSGNHNECTLADTFSQVWDRSECFVITSDAKLTGRIGRYRMQNLEGDACDKKDECITTL